MPPLAIRFDLDGIASFRRAKRPGRFSPAQTPLSNLGGGLCSKNISACSRIICSTRLASPLRWTKRIRSRWRVGSFSRSSTPDYAPDFVPGMVDVVTRPRSGICSLAVVSSNSTATIRRTVDAGWRRSLLLLTSSAATSNRTNAPSSGGFCRITPITFFNRDCSPAYREGDHPINPRVGERSRAGHRYDGRRASCERMRRSGRWASPGACTRKRDLLAAGADFVAVWPQVIVAQLLPAGFRTGVRDSSASEFWPPARAPACVANAATRGPSSPCKAGDDAKYEAGAVRRERALIRINATVASALYGSPAGAFAPAAAQAARRARARAASPIVEARFRAAQGAPP